MYTEGIKIGDNSYILSDEDGTLTLLSGKGTPEEIEEYIKLKNTWEEEIDNHRILQDELSYINGHNKLARDFNIFLSMMPVIAGIGTLIAGHLDLSVIIVMTILLDSFGLFLKLSLCGTKNKRINQEFKIKEELQAQTEKVKEIEKKINRLNKKVETETYFWEDEIIPVTTIENKKYNVKMKVLKLDTK